jgi:hypothetical protein
MPKYEISQFGNAVWNTILNNIAVDDLPIYYGELSRRFYGHKRAGRAFRHPLGQIHFNIKEWNSSRPKREQVPFLNAVVINLADQMPGGGYPGAEPDVPDVVEQIRSTPFDKWIAISKELGYKPTVVYRVGDRRKGFNLSFDDDFGDFGAKGTHKRSVTWVIPKHHPACEAVRDYLKSKGFRPRRPIRTRPDFFVERQGYTFVIEVKPNTAPQSIACGIGQLLLYGSALKADRLILAIPQSGDKRTLDDVAIEVLDKHQIGVMTFTYLSSKSAHVTSLEWPR